MSPRKFDRVMLDIEAGRNLKLRTLDDSEYRCFVSGVLPIAAKSPIRGCLLIGDRPADVDDLVAQSGVKRVRAGASALRKLREIGIVFVDDELGCERVHDFDDWNPAPKSDPTNAERQARYRERRAASRNATRNGASNGGGSNAVTPGREGKVEEKTPPTPPDGGSVVEPTRLDAARDRLKSDDVQAVFDEWVTVTSRTGRTVLDDKRRRLIRQALAAYPLDDVLDAVRGWRRSPHHRGENAGRTVYNDLGLLLRDPAHIERFRDLERGAGASAASGGPAGRDALLAGRRRAAAQHHRPEDAA